MRRSGQEQAQEERGPGTKEEGEITKLSICLYPQTIFNDFAMKHKNIWFNVQMEHQALVSQAIRLFFAGGVGLLGMVL